MGVSAEEDPKRRDEARVPWADVKSISESRAELSDRNSGLLMFDDYDCSVVVQHIVFAGGMSSGCELLGRNWYELHLRHEANKLTQLCRLPFLPTLPPGSGTPGTSAIMLRDRRACVRGSGALAALSSFGIRVNQASKSDCAVLVGAELEVSAFLDECMLGIDMPLESDCRQPRCRDSCVAGTGLLSGEESISKLEMDVLALATSPKRTLLRGREEPVDAERIEEAGNFKLLTLRELELAVLMLCVDVLDSNMRSSGMSCRRLEKFAGFRYAGCGTECVRSAE